MAERSDWYWCTQHDRVEREVDCTSSLRVGPYASEEEAAHWQADFTARNKRWDAEDRRWEQGR